MGNMQGEHFQPYGDAYKPAKEDGDDILPFFIKGRVLPKEVIPLRPIAEETVVTAIDVSSIKLGETTMGILCAIRGAIVWRENGRYKYLRLGPFPFHITEENRREIYGLFRQYSFERPEDSTAPSLLKIQARMGTLFERWLQMCVSCSCRHNLILWDGSLTAGTTDSPVSVMSQLLGTARNGMNSVLAFSKTSRLRLLGHWIVDLLWECQPPCLLEIGKGFHLSTGPMYCLGDIYIAKLAPRGCSFRLDIDRRISHEERVEAAQRLLGNDVLHQGYPETLRLAHILSTFTATEVIGIQRYVAQEWGLKIVERPNVRRLLFGPFGKGPEG